MAMRLLSSLVQSHCLPMLNAIKGLVHIHIEQTKFSTNAKPVLLHLSLNNTKITLVLPRKKQWIWRKEWVCSQILLAFLETGKNHPPLLPISIP